MARKIGSVDSWRFGIFLTTIPIVFTVVSRRELLLFKVWCLGVFGEAITSRNHEIFKLASKHGYSNILRVDFFNKIREISSSFLSGLHFMVVRKI